MCVCVFACFLACLAWRGVAWLGVACLFVCLFVYACGGVGFFCHLCVCLFFCCVCVCVYLYVFALCVCVCVCGWGVVVKTCLCVCACCCVWCVVSSCVRSWVCLSVFVLVFWHTRRTDKAHIACGHYDCHASDLTATCGDWGYCHGDNHIPSTDLLAASDAIPSSHLLAQHNLRDFGAISQLWSSCARSPRSPLRIPRPGPGARATCHAIPAASGTWSRCKRGRSFDAMGRRWSGPRLGHANLLCRWFCL